MKLNKLFATAALTLVTSAALAGLAQPEPTIVDLDNMYAQGDMRTARDAKNDVEHIGCGVRKFDFGGGNTFAFAFCQASDADENRVTCTTQSDYLMDGIHAIADNSFVNFNWTDDGAGNLECTRIGVFTQSFYLPKK